MKARSVRISSPRDVARQSLSRNAAFLTATSTVIASTLMSKSSNAATTATKQPLPITPRLMNPDESFLNGLISGAASRAAKEVILHPLDTLRAREQVPSNYSDDCIITPTPKFSNLYDGVVSALIGGIPAGAIFFAVKDYTKQRLTSSGFSKEAATLLAVSVANLPYWAIRTPSEVLKTQQQVGLYDTNSNSLYKNTINLLQNGKIYDSFGSNIAYSLPADVAKFLAYEALTSSILGKRGVSVGGEKIKGPEAAIIGALASLIAQTLTTPLDVARTRIMTNTTPSSSPIIALRDIIAEEGLPAAFSGLAPRSLRAIGSGAIQFASYELTQNLLIK